MGKLTLAILTSFLLVACSNIATVPDSDSPPVQNTVNLAKTGEVTFRWTYPERLVNNGAYELERSKAVAQARKALAVLYAAGTVKGGSFNNQIEAVTMGYATSKLRRSINANDPPTGTIFIRINGLDTLNETTYAIPYCVDKAYYNNSVTRDRAPNGWDDERIERGVVTVTRAVNAQGNMGAWKVVGFGPDTENYEDTTGEEQRELRTCSDWATSNNTPDAKVDPKIEFKSPS